MTGWLQSGHWFILNHCVNTIDEYENYSWDEEHDNTPEDGHDHLINSGQYGWIPYKTKIGGDADVGNN